MREIRVDDEALVWSMTEGRDGEIKSKTTVILVKPPHGAGIEQGGNSRNIEITESCDSNPNVGKAETQLEGHQSGNKFDGCEIIPVQQDRYATDGELISMFCRRIRTRLLDSHIAPNFSAKRRLMHRHCGSRREGSRRGLLSAKGPIRLTSCNAPAQLLQAASLFAIAGVTHKASCPRLGFPDYSFCLTSVVGLLMSTAPTSAYGRDDVVVEDWEHLRPSPAIDVDFSGRNSPSRLHDGFILSSTGTKITFPVRGSLYADNCGPKMSDMT